MGGRDRSIEAAPRRLTRLLVIAAGLAAGAACGGSSGAGATGQRGCYLAENECNCGSMPQKQGTIETGDECTPSSFGARGPLPCFESATGWGCGAFRCSCRG